jgi:hypothetical protein
VEPQEANHVTKHAGTWFRCLTKKVLKPEERKTLDGKDYLWYEKGFFTRWSHPGVCRVPCIGTPTELQDSFAMLRPLLDEVVKSFDDSTWRVTKQVRRIEQVQGFITSSSGHSALVAISAILSWRVWMIILNRVLSKTATCPIQPISALFSKNTSSASYANFILLFRWSANHISSAGSFG